MKRHVLRDSGTFPNLIFGLVCRKPLVQLVWNLNEVLNINFTRDEDLISDVAEEGGYWPRFTYFDEEYETTFSVIRNKGLNSLIAPEMRNVDAFLVETNHSLTFQLSLDKISKTRFIDFCFEIDPKMIGTDTQYLLNLE